MTLSGALVPLLEGGSDDQNRGVRDDDARDILVPGICTAICVGLRNHPRMSLVGHVASLVSGGRLGGSGR